MSDSPKPKKKQLLPGLGGQQAFSAFQGPKMGASAELDHMDLFKLQAQLEKAMTHHRRGELNIAEGMYKDILTMNPNQPDAMNLIGVINVAKGETQLAIDQLQMAVSLRPKDPTILNNLGNAFVNERRWEEAMDALEKAVALKPDFPEAYANLARAYRSNDRSDEAEHCYKRVLDILPDNGAALVGLARLYQDRGESERAEEILKRAMTEGKNPSGALMSFAQTRKFKEEPPELEDIKRLIAEAKRNSGEIVNLYYSAGKIFNDLGRYDEAFEHYAKGNELRGLEHDPKEFVNQVDAIIKIFDKKFFEDRQDFGIDSNRPIFIVGMPRSGTTLREQIISSHNKVFGAGELEYIKKLQMQSWQLTPGKTRFPESFPAMTKEGSIILGRRYLRYLEHHSSTAERVTDKMPHNFLNLGMMAIMFPKATFIHAKRNAVDTCLSCFFHNFNDAHSYNRNLTHMGLYYREYVRLTNHWHEVLGDRFYYSDYEALTENQEEESRKLIDHCGLEWDDNCLQFYKSDRAVLTPSNWQVRQPMYKSSTERWRRYEKHLGPLLEALGDLAPQ